MPNLGNVQQGGANAAGGGASEPFKPGYPYKCIITKAVDGVVESTKNNYTQLTVNVDPEGKNVPMPLRITWTTPADSINYARMSALGLVKEYKASKAGGPELNDPKIFEGLECYCLLEKETREGKEKYFNVDRLLSE